MTSYTSHQVDPGDILPAWQAMAIMQFIQAPPGDEVERFLSALNGDGTGSLRVDELPMGPGTVLEPLLLPEAAFAV